MSTWINYGCHNYRLCYYEKSIIKGRSSKCHSHLLNREGMGRVQLFKKILLFNTFFKCSNIFQEKNNFVLFLFTSVKIVLIDYILSPNQKFISLKLHRCRWTVAKCAWPIWSLRNGGHLSIHIDRIKVRFPNKQNICFYQPFSLLFYSMCSKSIWTILLSM